VSAVCCQVEVSAVVQNSTFECGVSECDRELQKLGGPGAQGAVMLQ